MHPVSHAWADLLSGRWPQIPAGSIVRIESPGRDWAVEKMLLIRGAEKMRDGDGFDRISAEELVPLDEEKGAILASRQHFLGLADAMEMLHRHCESDFGSDPVRWVQHPVDIVTMSDKAGCQELLRAGGVNVPVNLGIVAGFDDLMERMAALRCARVFLKLCHGSSASGAVAIETSGARLRAYTTARLVAGPDGGVRLRNWRAVTRMERLEDIRRLADAVCRHRAMAEAWVPKAGWQGFRFDVRVLVIAGQACHTVARLARGPFTNLQIGNGRRTADALRERIGGGAFSAMLEEAERAMACFPRSLHGGVDVALRAGDHRPFVLEVNAFGDLLPGVYHRGRDTYETELAALPGPRGHQVSATG